MVWPLIEFGSVFFFILFGTISLFEAGFLYKEDGESSIVVLVLAAIIGFAFVGNFPPLTYHWLVAYFLGGIVWVPIYWYLTLRKNRSKLLSSTRDSERCYHGIQSGNVWLPKHPGKSELVANGTMWFLAAPIHISNNWITLVIDLLSNIMSRVQKSLAVEVSQKD